jgi:hypothetical protein
LIFLSWVIYGYFLDDQKNVIKSITKSYPKLVARKSVIYSSSFELENPRLDIFKSATNYGASPECI